jgi:RHS repeat-associated protein
MNILKKPLALSMASMLFMSASYLHAQQAVSYTYNDNGQILTIDGSRTDVSDISSYTYNAEGYRASITNALGHIITLSDFNGRGQAQLITDANGIDTRLTYHVRGWLLSSEVVDPADTGDGSLNAITQYQYDHIGQVTRITLPNGVFLSYHYDTSNRLIAISNNTGERLEYTLDNAGNRLSETIKDGSNTIRYSMTRAYDELSRVMDIVGAQGQTQHVDYDVNDNPVQQINPRQYASQNTYDPLDRLTHTADADSGVTQFSYDDQDRLIRVTDANGNVTRYEYDAFDNLIKQISPDTGTTTYTYDSANNRTSMIDARGVTAYYTYDALNRLISVSYPNAAEENITYTYDVSTDNNGHAIYGIGRLVGISDHSGLSHYEYDHRGNVILHTQIIDQSTNDSAGVSYSTYYKYDLANQLTQMIYPNGLVVNYLRDNLSRVSGITTEYDGQLRIVADNIHYLPYGGITQLTYGNGISSTLSYDQDYRLEALSAHNTHNDSLQALQYQYDANGNIVQYDNLARTTLNQLFGYDPLDRLDTASGGYGQVHYAYDGVGNRSQYSEQTDQYQATEDYTLNNTSNQLTTVDSQHTMPAIIIDNNDANTELEGRWSTSSVQPPYQEDSLYSGDGQFTWQVDIPYEGNYDIQAWWTAHAHVRSDSAEYRFTSMDGQQTIIKSHKTDGGQWNSLGIHTLPKGTLAITLQNQPYQGGSVSADAIRVVASPLPSHKHYFRDVNGNTLERMQDGYTLSTNYNAANRPSEVSISRGDSTTYADYRYNALGLRVNKTLTDAQNTSETTHYHYNLQGQLISETQRHHHIEKNILYLNGQPIAVHTTDRATEGQAIIIDNQDENTLSVGSWRSSSVIPHYNGESLYASGNAQFTWRATLPQTQAYDIQAWWTSHSTRSAAAEYRFSTTAGDTLTTVDQRTGGGQWHSLGHHTLAAGTTDITLGNETYGVLSADAIRLVPLSTTQSLHYIHSDHLGTPQILTDQNQHKVWEATYDPFGKASIATEIVVYNLRFAGQYFDQETNLHYNWFRYYDPSTGRYTQSDFIGLGDGPNTYAYVANNPLIYIDPDGQSKKKLAEFILSIVLTIGGDGNGDGKPGGSPGRRDPTPNEQVQQDQKKKPKKKKGFGKKQGGFASPELLIGSIPVIGWMFGDGLACSSLDCDGDGLNDHTGQPMFPEYDPCIKP